LWNDANANGIQDGTETGIADVTVALNGTDGLSHAVADTTTTDANGHYQFTELRHLHGDGERAGGLHGLADRPGYGGDGQQREPERDDDADAGQRGQR